MLANLKQVANEGLNAIKVFDVFYHVEAAPYGARGESFYFLVDEQENYFINRN